MVQCMNTLRPECCNFFLQCRHHGIRNCSEACSAVASTNVFSHPHGAVNLLCAIGDRFPIANNFRGVSHDGEWAEFSENLLAYP
jgi:hypothetical protein